MAASSSKILAQRYELERLVAQGGCGMVYRALDHRSGQTVAIKMLSGATRQDPRFVERLLREQQVMQALAGTHAVAAIDLCRTDAGAVCLVMEWLDGMDMEQRLSELEARGERMPPGVLLAILRPLLETLEKAHELGIVHRDIKPANIFLLSGDGGVRLLDFGFSRLKSSATLTAADTVMGSPSYIAPEAWKEGSKAMGRQADLYSMAVIVFRALTGRLPFEGSSLVETMRLVTHPTRPSLCELRPDLPSALDVWGKRALALEPGDRFAFASHFGDALTAALDGLPLPEHTLPTFQLKHPTSIPPAQTSASERRGAFSAAVGRATALLKRLANSLTGAPEAPVAQAPDGQPPRTDELSPSGPPPARGERLEPMPTIPIQEPPAPQPTAPSAEPEADPLIQELLTAPSSPPAGVSETMLASPVEESTSPKKPRQSAKRVSQSNKPKRPTRRQQGSTTEQRAPEKPSARKKQQAPKKKRRTSKKKPDSEGQQAPEQRKKVRGQQQRSARKSASKKSSRRPRAKGK
jgi:eukaryotic-like serine/threonine-protein kinase